MVGVSASPATQRKTKMNEALWQKFLTEEIEDLPIVLWTIGVNGILGEFEFWLEKSGYLVYENKK